MIYSIADGIIVLWISIWPSVRYQVHGPEHSFFGDITFSNEFLNGNIFPIRFIALYTNLSHNTLGCSFCSVNHSHDVVYLYYVPWCWHAAGEQALFL